MIQDINRRIAIVTGASRQRSIGAAICRVLAQDGIDIFFTHWSPYDRFMQYQGEEAGWITGQIVHSRGGF